MSKLSGVPSRELEKLRERARVASEISYVRFKISARLRSSNVALATTEAREKASQ